MRFQVSAPPDAELVAEILSGRTDAEAALYGKYAARVYYIALRKSRSPHDAEDVRAETFLRVLQAIRGNQLRSADSLGSFILGTARNVLRELFLRQRKAGQTTPPDELDLIVPSHEKLFLDSEVQRAIECTIERLKPRERDILRMHFYEELPNEEIARRVGIAPERVRLVKSRALRHFREVYQEPDRVNKHENPDTGGR